MLHQIELWPYNTNFRFWKRNLWMGVNESWVWVQTKLFWNLHYTSDNLVIFKVQEIPDRGFEATAGLWLVFLRTSKNVIQILIWSLTHSHLAIDYSICYYRFFELTFKIMLLLSAHLFVSQCEKIDKFFWLEKYFVKSTCCEIP